MVTGSEKQIKWYEEILKEAYDYLDARYNHKIADEVEKQAVSLVRAEMEKALYKEGSRKVIATLEGD